MKNKPSLHAIAAALLLAATSGLTAIPSTVWRTDDTGYFDMWTDKTKLDTVSNFWPHASNWSVANPGTDSAMIVTNDLARVPNINWTNLVWRWQTDSTQKNFEIRFTWRMFNPSGNSGFNIRGYCAAGTLANMCNGLAGGYKVAGSQIDLGPTYTGDIWNSAGGGVAQGNLGPTAPTSCAVATATFQDLAMKVLNDTMFTYYYPNGFDSPSTRIQCTRHTYTFSGSVNATSPGLMALQYETQRVNNFKNIKIRNLDAVQAVSINGVRQLSPSLYSIRTGARSLRLGVTAAGSYSAEIADLSGRILHKVKGHGSSASQVIPLPQAGLYIVKISSSRGTALRKVVVR